jgi:tRNA-binding EMAP/Myf-like protein
MFVGRSKRSPSYGLPACRFSGKRHVVQLKSDSHVCNRSLLTFRFMREPGVIIGRVVETRPHPYRQRIWLSTVDIGTDCKPQIVWGGMPIVRTGCLVPVAQPGAWLPPTLKKPEWYKIRRRRYAGEISDGMLCSLAELGWDPSVTDWVALLDTSADLRVGRPLEVKAPVEDWQAIALRIDACKAYKLAASEFEDSLCKFLASLVTLDSRPLGWDARHDHPPGWDPPQDAMLLPALAGDAQ